jgi:EAL domain-containing protein (putative c-di-GMP-specific phosphodiesterase class I)
VRPWKDRNAHGAGVRDLLVADDADRASWLLMVRALGTLWIAGGATVELWLALYGAHARQPGVVLAVALAAQAIGIVLGLTARRTPPPWLGHVILLAAAAAVSVVSWATRGADNGFELIYLWPAPYAFVLVRPRAAVAHVGVYAACMVAHALADPDGASAGRWLLAAMTVAAISLTSAYLVTGLRSGQRLLNRAFEDAAVGMAYVDTRGRWIAANAALRTLLGRADDALAGRPVTELLAWEDLAPQRAPGCEAWVEVRRAPVHDTQGRLACWSLQVLDVTERREAEEALRVDADQARWADEVRAAIEEDRIALYAQPLVALDRSEHAGHELLARLVQTDGTVVSPGAFMPAVERFGLAPVFDTHVLRRAAEVVAEGRPLHVNLSAHSVGRPEVMAALRDALDASGADPGLLTLEITETALSDDVAAHTAFGREVRELGCRLALDDFGTGYGTLTYLTALQFAEIKIDRDFVGRMREDAGSADVVRAVIGLARSLGATAVAEGVEDEETLEMVRGLGVDVAQGYLFGRPAALEDVLPPLSAAGR